MAVFEGLKRRRGSWRLPFLGDYLDAAEAPEVTRMLLKAGEARVYFADRITHVNRNGKAQERILLISDRSVYVLAPTKWRVNVRVAFDELEGISLSTFADGFMVVHVGGGAKGGGAALLLQVQRKAEVVTMLVQEAGASVVCSDTIEFRSKRAGMFETSATETRTITFVESAATAGSAALLDEKSAATGQLRVLVPPVLGSKAELQIGKGGAAPAA